MYALLFSVIRFTVCSSLLFLSQITVCFFVFTACYDQTVEQEDTGGLLMTAVAVLVILPVSYALNDQQNRNNLKKLFLRPFSNCIIYVGESVCPVDFK